MTSALDYLVSTMFGSLTGWMTSVIALLYALWYISKTRRHKNLPPGVDGIPILGFLPFLKKDRPKQFKELAEKYGPVFRVQMGSRLFIALNGYDTIRKALIEKGDAFAGRGKNIINCVDPIIERHIGFSDGTHWREHRKFAVNKLRDYGVGQSRIEPAVLNEMSYFLDEVEKHKNTDFDITETLGLSICNNVVIMLLGNRLEYTDPNFQKCKWMVDVMLTHLFGLPHVFMPWLNYIPGNQWLFGIGKLKDIHQTFNKYMIEQIQKHRKEYKDGDDNDYINAFFTETKRRIKNNDYQALFDDETLTVILKGMFVAGMETTTTTIRWAILYMMVHPDIQRKVHKEIDDVIGAHRLPSVDDRVMMPYTEAVLLEVQRIGSVAPLSVVHRVMKDTELNGYNIPKDTLVFPNLYSIHYDEKLYPDPESFRPERFLNDEGQVIKPDHLFPFSMGKRMCIGQPLAHMEIFLYFTSLLQRFSFEAPEGSTLVTDANISIVRTPNPFNAHITLRNKV